MIDVTVTQDYNMVSATANKINKYKDMQIETKKCWNLKTLLLGRLIFLYSGLRETALQRTCQIYQTTYQQELYRILNYLEHHTLCETSYLKSKYGHAKYTIMALALNFPPT